MRIMNEKQWPYCTLQLPEKGLGDLQIAAEYIVYAVRRIYRKSLKEKEKGFREKRRINIIGHSVRGNRFKIFTSILARYSKNGLSFNCIWSNSSWNNAC